MANRYTGTGYLAADPEYKQFQGKDGKPREVVSCRVAVDGMRRGGQTGYLKVEQYGAGAKPVAEHLHKGSFIAVDGRLDQHVWKDDQDNNRSELQVVGQIEFGPKTARDDDGREQQQGQEQESEQQSEEGDPEPLRPGSAMDLAQHTAVATAPVAAAVLGR